MRSINTKKYKHTFSNKTRMPVRLLIPRKTHSQTTIYAKLRFYLDKSKSNGVPDLIFGNSSFPICKSVNDLPALYKKLCTIIEMRNRYAMKGIVPCEFVYEVTLHGRLNGHLIDQVFDSKSFHTIQNIGLLLEKKDFNKIPFHNDSWNAPIIRNMVKDIPAHILLRMMPALNAIFNSSSPNAIELAIEYLTHHPFGSDADIVTSSVLQSEKAFNVTWTQRVKEVDIRAAVDEFYVLLQAARFHQFQPLLLGNVAMLILEHLLPKLPPEQMRICKNNIVALGRRIGLFEPRSVFIEKDPMPENVLQLTL